jgi:3-deoxy-D-manno-octulosonate 8-phosphate phosphatase (KDO 8-P phosphatase)
MRLDPDELTVRARAVRLILLDVDGVLTDGTVEISSDGTESKTFSIRDGAAILWARREGLVVGLLSGRPSPATTRRAAELGIDLVVETGPDKRIAFDQILSSQRLMETEVAYMGDDLLDLPILARVGLSAAPADAVDEVLTLAHWVSGRPGGRGAVRELVELILRARLRWQAVVGQHLSHGNHLT